MKSIGIVKELHKKAIKKPREYVRKGSYLGFYDDRDGSFGLSHYGVDIFKYDAKTFSIGKGAYSASDRDAINTMLSEIGEHRYCARIRDYRLGIDGVDGNRRFIGIV